MFLTQCFTPAQGSGMEGMKLPIGMTRRALSYDDNLEAPMSTPPHDISINNLWRRPVIPERKFPYLAEDESGSVTMSHPAVHSAPSRSPTVVKTKASSIIMNSLITKQTHDSVYNFEQRAGLTDKSYTPHKGLMADESRLHHRMPESFQVSMNMLGGSSGVTVCVTSHVPRSSLFLVNPRLKTNVVWFCHCHILPCSLFPAGFALQAYRGAQKPTPMEVMKSQATRLGDTPSAQQVAPPKMEIPTMEGRRQGARPHKLKHRDMNILTPSGF
uniref:Putative monooxygenase p33MONOX n=1 Tax=Sphaeramia orbicularis TaxID=375764 RepID=A0A672YPZ5_9TELE